MEACSLRYAERYGYARGRADERADVVAYLVESRPGDAAEIVAGEHVGAAKKEGA